MRNDKLLTLDGHVSEVYIYEDSEKIYFETLKLPKHFDWKDKNKAADSFRKNIRRHLYVYQDGVCVFCGTLLNFLGYAEHLEHFVHKDKYRKWTYLPINLSLSCSECNTYKGIKPTLVREDLYSDTKDLPFPDSPDSFQVVNPVYERISDYIFITNEIIAYSRKELKGDKLQKAKNSLGTFGLNRFQLLYLRAVKKGLSTHSISKLLFRIYNDKDLDAKTKKFVGEQLNMLTKLSLIKLSHIKKKIRLNEGE